MERQIQLGAAIRSVMLPSSRTRREPSRSVDLCQDGQPLEGPSAKKLRRCSDQRARFWASTFRLTAQQAARAVAAGKGLSISYRQNTNGGIAPQ